MEELGIDADVREIPVESPEEAGQLGFLGSPTVRVEGDDVEPGAETATGLADMTQTSTRAGEPVRFLERGIRMRAAAPTKTTLRRRDEMREAALHLLPGITKRGAPASRGRSVATCDPQLPPPFSYMSGVRLLWSNIMVAACALRHRSRERRERSFSSASACPRSPPSRFRLSCPSLPSFPPFNPASARASTFQAAATTIAAETVATAAQPLSVKKPAIVVVWFPNQRAATITAAIHVPTA